MERTPHNHGLEEPCGLDDVHVDVGDGPVLDLHGNGSVTLDTGHMVHQKFAHRFASLQALNSSIALSMSAGSSPLSPRTFAA